MAGCVCVMKTVNTAVDSLARDPGQKFIMVKHVSTSEGSSLLSIQFWWICCMVASMSLPHEAWRWRHHRSAGLVHESEWLRHWHHWFRRRAAATRGNACKVLSVFGLLNVLVLWFSLHWVLREYWGKLHACSNLGNNCWALFINCHCLCCVSDLRVSSFPMVYFDLQSNIND